MCLAVLKVAGKLRAALNKVTNKHNVLQEEVGGIGKYMINRSLWPVMN